MKYRVYKEDGTKCIRKFDSIEDAKAWAWTRDNGNTYRIEWKYDNEHSPRHMYI